MDKMKELKRLRDSLDKAYDILDRMIEKEDDQMNLEAYEDMMDNLEKLQMETESEIIDIIETDLNSKQLEEHCR